MHLAAFAAFLISVAITSAVPWRAEISNEIPPLQFSVSTAEAHELSLQERSNLIAAEYGISTTTLWNLVMEESSGGLKRVGDDGEACGVIHINKNFYPAEFERCADDDFVLRFAADLIARGEESKFTSCSCVQYVRLFVGSRLPRQDAKDFVPNSAPAVGAVAIYNYDGVYHVGYVAEIKDGGWIERGSNLEPCKSYTRFVKSSPHLVGFYAPPPLGAVR